MYILIDMTNVVPLARHSSYKALAALAYIQFANIDTHIIPLNDKNAHWSIFDADQLVRLATCAHFGVNYTVNPRAPDYTQLIVQVREGLARAKYLLLPFNAADLVAQAKQIGKHDARPYAFSPEGAKPDLLDKWTRQPNANRPRIDGPHWVHFTDAVPAEAIPAPAPVAKGGPKPRSAPTNPAQPVPATPAAPAPAAPRVALRGSCPADVAERMAPTGKPKPSPKPSGAERGLYKRPKAGTTTGRVWELCDQLAKKHKDAKSCRKAVVDACKEEGIKETTAAANFTAWKSVTGNYKD